MKGFDSFKTITVTLARPGVEVAYTLKAPPPGWRAALLTVCPVPQLWVRDVHKGEDPEAAPAYYRALKMVLLAKFMEDEVDFEVKVTDTAQLHAVAEKMMTACAAAHLTGGEVDQLYSAGFDAFVKVQEGNE